MSSVMKALVLHDSGIDYQTDREMPRLTSCFDVLVEVHFAGICRTDIGIAERNIPAKANIVMGHEFCGRIAGFVNGDDEMEGWHVGDVVSANPMVFSDKGDMMCGKECDGAFAEYIAVPHQALIKLPPYFLSPLGAFLEPVAAALAPLKHIDGRDRVCIFGANRIAALTSQVARAMGHQHIERVTRLDALEKDHYDCIIETEPAHIDAYVDALKPGGLLILKSRSFAPSTIISNTIAMKEICIQGARYGDFGVASHILAASAHGVKHTLDTSTLFGPVYELSDYEKAFTEAALPRNKKIFFKLCAE